MKYEVKLERREMITEANILVVYYRKTFKFSGGGILGLACLPCRLSAKELELFKNYELDQRSIYII